MKILIVNKFLYPNGGSETYIFEIGKQLQKMGHEVQYFGMEHEGRIVGNHAESYTSNMDFHTGKLAKMLYPFKIIYSKEARQKIQVVLEDFKPDVVHLNNINFQLTPSILYEIKSFSKKTGHNVKIVATAHDYQWICPNHMLYIPHREEICVRCVKGRFRNCIKYKCIHNSKVKSILGALEAYFYSVMRTYDLIDMIICPSEFMKQKLSNNKLLVGKLTVMHNFVTVDQSGFDVNIVDKKKDNYVLYFGRYSKEKGVETLLEVCKRLPEIPFVFAGSGPLEEKINKVANIKNVGFQTGDELKDLIRKAQFSIYPSEWYENCPFSVMESIMYGTPVIAADIGGIPELIREGVDGELFESGHIEMLLTLIKKYYGASEGNTRDIKKCKDNNFDSLPVYCDKLLELYSK